jgi:cytochrome c oxidase assembly protein subunit 15
VYLLINSDRQRRENGINRTEKQFSLCLLSLLAATLLINVLSSYIRHHEAGLDCVDWPACYGQVGKQSDPSTDITTTLTPPTPSSATLAALTPTDAVKQTHRSIASVLVILVLLMVYLARLQNFKGAAFYLPYAVIAVVLLLAIIGPASYLKTLPAVATANLAGGMLLLSLLWWLWLVTRPTAPEPLPQLKGLETPLLIALIALIGQILLGAWVSANFAGTACRGFMDCASLSPSLSEEGAESGWSSFWYLRELALSTDGSIVMGQAQILIQQAHQLGALIIFVLLASCAIKVVRSGADNRGWGIGLLLLLLLQIGLGFGALNWELPLVIVLGHNLTASLLLLGVIRVNLLTRGSSRGSSRGRSR